MPIYRSDKPVGVVLSTVTDTCLADLVAIAKHAEKCGLESVYINEGRGDAIAICTVIAQNTTTISLGTNIANIYFRHPYLAAHSIKTLAETSEDRARIGFGISHRGVLETIGIEMGDARTSLKQYILNVKSFLRGQSKNGLLSSDKAKYKTPIFAAANTVETAVIAGSVADGIMPYLTPLSALPRLLGVAEREAMKTTDVNRFDCILSIPTFLSNNEREAISAARYNLAFFAGLPNYRRQWRRAGFSKEMDLIKARHKQKANRKDIASLIPLELIDEVCIYGNTKQCHKKIEAFRNQGVTEPVLAISPVSQNRHDATISAIKEISRR